MKLSLQTTKQADGWTIEYRLNNDHTLLPSRTLRRIGEAEKGFPLPPPEESAHWQNKSHEMLCDAREASVLETHFRKLVHGEPQAGDIRTFGNYLTAVLFGQNWEAACIKAEQNEEIEIELHFSPDDIELQRLPWEMMYDEQLPFAAVPDRGIAIARIIKQQNLQDNKINLNMPLKVLFVIGSKLDNALRPGAEYLGLLRQMKIKLGDETRNRTLNVKIITQATIDEIESLVNDFKPTVVHFICHGDDEGRLLLAKYNEQKTGKTDKADLCDAARLLESLRQNQPPHNVPPIIVLNACHTSEISESGKESYNSLAAQLVAGGVAVAIGMRGEVADGVCRVFTRRFYQALVTDNPININHSTAHGRRAAMLHFVKYYDEAKYYENNVEWARPTLFLSDNLSLELMNNEMACALAESPQKFIIDNSTFCDRLSYLQHYQEFRGDIVSNNNGKMLLFSSNVPNNNVEQYGKTRLLRELAIQVLLDGLIPCAIFSNRAVEPPKNLLSFALEIADAMNETRSIFGLPERRDSFALKLAAIYFKTDLPDVEQDFEFELEKASVKQKAARSQDFPAPDTVRMAMLKDFKILKQDLARFNLNAPILVLLDDLHKYEGVTADLLNNNFFKDKGLGDNDTPVAIIATYSTNGEQSNARKDIEDFIKSVNGRVYARKAIELQPIIEFDEARMAYAQHLISKEEPLAVSTRSDKQEDVNNLFEAMHTHIKGVPSFFNDRGLVPLLKFAVTAKLLLKANDEQIYENLVNGGNDI
jgi:hypothetical protein